MKSHLLSICLTFLVFATQTTGSQAASFQITDLKEKLSLIDSILIGNVISIETKNIIDVEKIRDLGDVDLYSIITVDNAQTLEQFGLSALPGKAQIFVDGGVIEMPRSLKKKYKKEYLVQGNSALPSIEIDAINPYVFFIVGNGKFETPFLDIDKSVLKVSADGSVLTNSGRPILGIADNDFEIKYDAPIRSTPDFSEGPVDPNPTKLDNSNTNRSPLPFTKFVEELSNLVAFDDEI